LSGGETVSEIRCEQTGNSVLHLAVNGSSDNADQSLELESTLVKNGCDVFAVNNLKRYALPTIETSIKINLSLLYFPTNHFAKYLSF
jgi:hypothetical protein